MNFAESGIFYKKHFAESGFYLCNQIKISRDKYRINSKRY